MPLRRKLGTHLRWRNERFRHWYRGQLFDLAGHHRSMVRTRDRHGNQYVVSTRDTVIGRAMYVHGAFDTAKVDNALWALSQRGITLTRALDIGANIGTMALELLARRPDIRVECFEPEPFNYRLLTRNLAANARGRANAHPLALSDADGPLTFELSPDNAGDHRVRANVESGALGESDRRTITVPARRLDGLNIECDEQTFACIDVQGHEWNVLLGGAASLSGPITLEFWPYALALNGRLDDLIAYLGDMGRSILDITHDVVSTDPSTLARQARNRAPDFALELLILPS